jgi:ribonucleoside-diphosphate reductase alpha chain
MFNEYWSDGNPSVTIYVSDEEWVEVGSWVYRNWDSVCGLSFLPKDNGVYQLAPYEEIDASIYYELLKPWKNIDIDFNVELSSYELVDSTEGAKTFACTGGSCEL